MHERVTSFGSVYTTDSTVTSVGDRCYRFEGAGTSGQVSGGRAVTGAPDGAASFTYDIELGLKGAIRWLAPLVRFTMRRRVAGDLRRLKALLESS